MSNNETSRIYPVIRQTNEETFILATSREEAEAIARKLPSSAWTDRLEVDFIVNDEFSAEETLDILTGNGTSYYTHPRF